MASMEDLIATISDGMHVGQQSNDLKDLHAKLTQTLHPTKAPFRPIPPPMFSPLANSGPVPPPAPASSWNDDILLSSSASAFNAWGGMGNSPRQTAPFIDKGESGFSIPPPKGQGQGQGTVGGNGGDMSYHTSVLPIKASPKDTGGFGDDTFKPLWNGGEEKPV